MARFLAAGRRIYGALDAPTWRRCHSEIAPSTGCGPQAWFCHGTQVSYHIRTARRRREGVTASAAFLCACRPVAPRYTTTRMIRAAARSISRPFLLPWTGTRAARARRHGQEPTQEDRVYMRVLSVACFLLHAADHAVSTWLYPVRAFRGGVLGRLWLVLLCIVASFPVCCSLRSLP
jgi:hypothetical protein